MVTTTRRADTLTAELIAALVQELRESLAGVKISVQTLLRQDIAREPAMQRELLEHINNECERCHRLVTGIEATLVPSPAETELEMILQKTSSAPVVSGDFVIQPGNCVVTVRGKQVKLTNTEHKLLLFMARNAGRLLPHQTLLAEVWGDEYPRDPWCLRAYIKRLRQKLRDNGHGTEYIFSKYRMGYKLITHNGKRRRQEP